MKVPFVSHDGKGLTCTAKGCYTLLAKREDGKDEYNGCMNHQKIRQNFCLHEIHFVSHDRKGLTCTVKECYTLLAKREDGKDEYNRCMNHQKIRQCMHQGCNMMSCRAVVHIGANKKKYNYPGMPLQGPGQFWSLCKAW